VGGNIDNVNQDEIESVDVLKGGAASAIYGTRGGNGVILITTKKGNTQPQAFYDGYLAFDMPNNKIRVLTAEQFIPRNRGADYGGNTDWFKALSRPYAFQHKHTMQFSGGLSAGTNYMVSMDYKDANGIDLRSSRKEYGGRIHVNHTAANNLYSFSANFAPRYAKYNNADYSAFNYALSLNPTFPVMDTVDREKYYNVPGINIPNPVEVAKTILSGGEAKFLDWDASFKLNILKNLNTQVTLAQVTRDYFDFGFTPSTYTDAPIGGTGTMSVGSRSYTKNNQVNFEWTGNYTLDFHNHSLKLLAGYSYYYFNNSGMNAGNSNFPSDAITYNNLGNGVYDQPISGTATGDQTYREVGSFQDDSKLIAFFGRLIYNYDRRYFFSASLRREGSSKFGTDNKWGYFPAASFGWMVSNEKFFPQADWLNSLKLRADYGETGNQDFASYLSLSTYSGFGYVNYQGISYQTWGPSQNTNYNLRWEKAKNFNIGLDFDLFGSKLTGSLNYYVRTNNDLLGNYNVPIPPNLIDHTYLNVGKMKNSGLEIQLNANLISGKDFSYSASFAGATNDNKFVSFSNDVYHGQSFVDLVNMPSPGSPGYAQRLQEGTRVGSFYMLHAAGYSSSGSLMVYDKDGKIIPANTANDGDKRFVGNGLPKFTASLGNNFRYKNFDLGIYLRGAFGYQVYNTNAFYFGTPATQSGFNTLRSAYEIGNKGFKLTNQATSSSLSDYFLQQGDFIKIDNVSLGYNWNAPVKYITAARFYLTGRNLYTFSYWDTGDIESINVNGLTPGINTDANGYGSREYYPSTMQIIVGLQLKF
jgi:TonB-linked SusC/RagA family outer membrane protein